ncbi:MAG: VOC family protein [Cyanobacteria bacterium P01_A01_bin.135]
MASEVSYLEIGAKDAEETRQFFEQLLGWRFTPMGDKGEGWFQMPSIRAGLHGNDSEPQLLVFFRVDDLELAIAQVKKLGGAADRPGDNEPGFGRFCICCDPQGVRFGLHQSPGR